jgi:hypothetical protein
MPTRLLRRLAVLALLSAASATAQTPTPPSAPPPPGSGAQPAPSTPAISLSGVLYGNYQYSTAAATREANQFVIDRVYLNVRAALGQGFGVRLTTDVYQSGDANAFTVREKYAYLQYDRGRPGTGWSGFARAGILQTVTIEFEEQFWPRFLGTTAVDRYGWFSSADDGIAGQLTFPRRLGEVYATVTNGNGFGRRETDRFKDVALRISLTPLAARTTGLLSTFTVSAWGYRGAAGSRFATGGAGQAAAVHEGLTRDRAGAFVGIRDPRLVLGVSHATRADGVESGENTLASPRTVTTVDGRATSTFAVVRPIAFLRHTPTSRLGLVGRYDLLDPGTSATRPGPRAERVHHAMGGVLYDLHPRDVAALDYQEQLARDDRYPETKSWFAHLAVTF